MQMMMIKVIILKIMMVKITTTKEFRQMPRFPTRAFKVIVDYYKSTRALLQIFTQPTDTNDVTRVTLNRLNSIDAIDVTRVKCQMSNVKCQMSNVKC